MTTIIKSRGDLQLDPSGRLVVHQVEVADPDQSENSNVVATTRWVRTAVTELIGGAPGVLDTLGEISTAIGNDPNFINNITTLANNAVIRAGDTMTGPLIMSRDPQLPLEATTKQWVEYKLNEQTTDFIEEGTNNLYFLTSRARNSVFVVDNDIQPTFLSYDNISGQIRYNPRTDRLIEVYSARFFTEARAQASLSYTTGVANYNPASGLITIPRNTTHIDEGINRYFTEIRARESISVQGPLLYNNQTGLLNVPASGVVPGVYAYANVTVDSYGRVTHIEDGTGNGPISTNTNGGNTTISLITEGNGSVEIMGNTSIGGGNLNVAGNIHATGSITADGNIQLGNAATDTVTFAAEINSDIVPLSTDTYNIGSVTNRWLTTYSKTTVNNKQILVSDADPTVNTSNYVLTCTTTDAIPTELTIVGTNKIHIPSGASASFEVKFVGANSLQRYGSIVKGLLINNGGVLTLVGSTVNEVLASTGGTLNAAVTVTGDVLTITATGVASNTIKWTAFASVTTVTF
jgi:hypothetical protein